MEQRVNNIPVQMRETAQWVNWRYGTDDKGKQTKIPLNPHSGQKADVTNPEHHSSFDHALGNAMRHGVGIGFALTQNDPFVCVDLDDPVGKINPMQHDRIYQNFNNIITDANSYTEWSPSGNGAHVWMLADIPPNGVRSPDDCIELYSTARFLTVTGNSWHAQALPLNRNDELAKAIHNALDRRSGRDVDVIEQEARHTPEQLIEHILTWQNGDMFRKLMNMPFGEGDDSGIDQGVMNFIVQACRNVELSRAAFSLTPRANRDKWRTRTDYQNRTIKRAFDKLENVPEIDISGLVKQIKEQLSEAEQVKQIAQESQQQQTHHTPAAQAAEASATPAWERVERFGDDGAVNGPGCFRNPGGLLGALMDHFYRSAYKPCPEIALAAALGTMTAVVGRAYNAGGLGLNLYVVLLANTGTGKNVAIQGPTHILKTVASKNRAFEEFIGDRHASAQALVKSFSHKKSFCSFFDEFGELFARMTSGNQADANMANMLGPMMELYTASGRKGFLPSTLHSNKDNNSKAISAPAFSFVGASVPKTFYECLSGDMATKGLLSRLSIINVESKPAPFNDACYLVQPSDQLLDALFTLCQTAQQINGGFPHNPIDVRFPPESESMWRRFRDDCDSFVHANSEQDHIASLWSRCAEKARKIAGIVAVGYNPYTPTVTAEMMQWAMDFARHDAAYIIGKFERGETGKEDNEAERIELIKKSILRFLGKDEHHRVHWNYAKKSGWIPKAWFTMELTKKAAFKKARNGFIPPLEAVELTLKALLSFGIIAVVRDANYTNGFPVEGTLYRIVDSSWLQDKAK
jgi:hypothetical protein